MNLSNSGNIFLETTIFFQWLLGSNSDKSRILHVLGGNQRLSSTYVQAEYHTAAFRAVVSMYNLLCNMASIEDAVAEWNKQRGGHYKRGIEMLLIAVSRFFCGVGCFLQSAEVALIEQKQSTS